MSKPPAREAVCQLLVVQLLALGLAATACRGLLAGFQLREVEASFDATAPVDAPSRTVVADDGERAGPFVRARLDGEDLGWYLLDSGAAVTVVDAGHVASLGLERVASAPVSGCDLTLGVHRGSTLEIGQLVLEDPVIASLDFSRVDAFDEIEELLGEVPAGILGYDVFAAAVVEIRYADTTEGVAVHDPEAYRLKEGRWRDFRFVEHTPAVPATLEGEQDLWVTLDTGKTGSLSLYPEFVEAAGLLRGRATEEVTNRRLCGDTVELRAEVEWFELAGRRFESPSVRFKPAGTPGAEAEAFEDGVVGQGFLRAFTTVFDYPNRRVALVPR